MRKECCKTLLLSEVSSWLQQRNTSLEAHRRMCRGGQRTVGLITSGQVLDCCPPAVLFYPIRNSICCPTQLLSGHTSHPHRWEHCVCVRVCVFAFVAVFYTNDINTLVSGKKQGFSCSFSSRGARIDDTQKNNPQTDRREFRVMDHCCNAFLIPAHLFTPKQSNSGCQRSFD